MALGSQIEWTEATWNPVTGCTKISKGCKNCYAERMASRLMAMGMPKYKHGFKVQTHARMLEEPLSWKKPRRVFVNSMSDLFHDDIPDEFILDVFAIMARSTQHQFQVLTKRAERLFSLNRYIKWPENVWMGVTVEHSEYLFRKKLLKKCGAKVKFLSIEPLLGPIGNLALTNIDWVIVGGESGPNARQIEEEWVLDIRDNCLRQNVPFFFKQWGGFFKKKAGRVLQNKIWNQMPLFADS